MYKVCTVVLLHCIDSRLSLTWIFIGLWKLHLIQSRLLAEYIPGGSLHDYIRKHHGSLSLPQLLSFAIDISKGMGYLHCNNIIHRDLKTPNLLVDGEDVCPFIIIAVASGNTLCFWYPSLKFELKLASYHKWYWFASYIWSPLYLHLLIFIHFFLLLLLIAYNHQVRC
jgi:serine/threonine protein kinase